MEYKGLESKGKGSIRVGDDYGTGEQRKGSVRAKYSHKINSFVSTGTM